MLTPEEFVIAGNNLTYKFPIWKWAETSEKNEVNYLPHNKQMIIMKNIFLVLIHIVKISN